MENSTLPKETDVPVLDDKVYGMKDHSYMLKYKEVRAKKIAWVELNANIRNLCLEQSTPGLKLLF